MELAHEHFKRIECLLFMLGNYYFSFYVIELFRVFLAEHAGQR
jgi:hypothetical protein